MKTVEEKAKVYTELINRLEDVKDAIKKQNYGIAMEILCKPYTPFQVITHSELTESEDERIRKHLIKHFGNKSKEDWNGVPLKSILAWLEKRGETFTKKDVDDAYLKGVTNTKNEIEKQYEANYQIRKDIATFIFNYRGDIKDRAKWIDYLGIKVSFIENQGEQKHIPKHKIGDTIYYYSFGKVESMIVANVTTDSTDNPMYEDKEGNAVFERALVEQNPAEKVEPKFKVGDKVVHKGTGKLWTVHWYIKENNVYSVEDSEGLIHVYSPDVLELAEQKPADKVKPKFKAGDWVVVDDGRTGRIIECTKDFADVDLEFSCLSTRVNNIRSWTIQDAKDGDVLYMDNGLSTCIFIYKSINNIIIQKYASYNKFGFEGTTYLVLNDGYVCPATKEQHDILFQEMKEAGYEWDTEHKQLKKIEKNPAWSEEDEVMFRKAIITIDNVRMNTGLSEYYQGISKWLKSLKDRVLPQPKREWSEEDEQMLNDIIKDLVHPWNEYIPDRIEDEIIWLKNRLKSLRPQKQWKPTERQLSALDYQVKSTCQTSWQYKETKELLEQLKKLREE